jgi:tetratricopeptide (TPR) repeat protein
MRGRALAIRSYQRLTNDDNNAVRALYEQALKIDPNNVDALVGVASTYSNEHNLGWTNPETDYDAKILGQLDRAIALAPDKALGAYVTKSYFLGLSHRYNEAVRAANAGIAINPNYALLYSARGTAEISLGRFEQAKSDFQQAMRLSPRDPFMFMWQLQLGDVEIGAGRIKASIDEYQKAFDAGYHGFFIYANLAAAYALEGRMDEAKSAMAEARRLNPSLTIKWYKEHAEDIPIRSEGFRKVGLPEE